MAIATPEVYAEMIDRAKAGKFAYPAVNITSSQTVTAALQGFAEAESDGILQVSVGGAEYASGSTVKDRVAGTRALAAYAAEVAKGYGITVALHTDHCVKKNLDSWVRPLLALEAEEVKAGKNPTFQSHMFDGSDIPLDENLVIAAELLELSQDGLATVRALGAGEKGRYLTALTFGNVHGVYKPGAVKLRPSILADIQKAVGAEIGKESPFDLVFHGGSGSTAAEIAEAVDNGVIKMNIDTDTQYAFTRPVVAHMFTNYDGVLKVDGEVGNKKAYDPRAWGKLAEAGMAARIVEAAQQLRSAGQRLR
jgi:fructose-bisphosphate aldolase class II